MEVIITYTSSREVLDLNPNRLYNKPFLKE